MATILSILLFNAFAHSYDEAEKQNTNMMIAKTSLIELLKDKKAGIKGKQDFIQQIMPK